MKGFKWFERWNMKANSLRSKCPIVSCRSLFAFLMPLLAVAAVARLG